MFEIEDEKWPLNKGQMNTRRKTYRERRNNIIYITNIVSEMGLISI